MNDSQSLARLLALDADSADWNSVDLAAILEHQLRAPLEADLARSAPGKKRTLAELTHTTTRPITTFADLFADPAPPVDLLIFVKDFAKSARLAKTGPLPEEVATALYYAAIAKALVCHKTKITNMTVDALRDGLNWALRQPWISGPLREILAEVNL